MAILHMPMLKAIDVEVHSIIITALQLAITRGALKKRPAYPRKDSDSL